MDGLKRPGMIDNWLREGRAWQPSSMQPESIQQPCLMVHGDEDARVPIEVARETARRLPAGALREVAGSGHWPFLTHVEEVEREIEQFIG